VSSSIVSIVAQDQLFDSYEAEINEVADDFVALKVQNAEVLSERASLIVRQCELVSEVELRETILAAMKPAHGGCTYWQVISRLAFMVYQNHSRFLLACFHRWRRQAGPSPSMALTSHHPKDIWVQDDATRHQDSAQGRGQGQGQAGLPKPYRDLELQHLEERYARLQSQYDHLIAQQQRSMNRKHRKTTTL
jgi:hypothetical protein